MSQQPHAPGQASATQLNGASEEPLSACTGQHLAALADAFGDSIQPGCT